MAIDSHMHINSVVLDNNQLYIDDINKNPNIESVINVGLNIKTSLESIEISKTNPKFYSSVGIHPLYIENQDVNALYDLANNIKIVAIGEIGFDNGKNNFEDQKRYLIKQIEIANELKLPVIIHSNNSNEKIVDIFKIYVKPKYGCVFHCFQPDFDTLKYIINEGFYISFAGKITYKTAKKSIEIARIIPDDLFIVETDSPYISIEPFRNEINKSSNIKYIINKLSEVKEKSYEEIENITRENTKRLFKRMK